jgi:hypothetical protein
MTIKFCCFTSPTVQRETLMWHYVDMRLQSITRDYPFLFYFSFFYLSLDQGGSFVINPLPSDHREYYMDLQLAPAVVLWSNGCRCAQSRIPDNWGKKSMSCLGSTRLLPD